MLFAWQGWKIEIPHRWNPLRLEGDYDEGYALIADLQGPRLGIRWKKAGNRKFDADAWARLAIARESGVLAADESQPLPIPQTAADFACAWEGGRLYTEPQPPGRDVWVAHSTSSGRSVQVVYHAQRRENALAHRLLPTLCDQSPRDAMLWAAFDLLCLVPAGWKLLRQRLNVGDLSLTFSAGRRQLTVRQVALASLALKRMPLERWLCDQVELRRKHYRIEGEAQTFQQASLRGLQLASHRRRRFFLARYLPQQFVTIGVEDVARDRLVLVDATDLSLAIEALATVSSPLDPAFLAREAS